MDASVRAAMARWPGVPAVHGWLALDARGRWRLGGGAIGNPAIVAFIGRNYAPDERGAWYFQNGPQRVYVALERAPWVLRLTPAGALTHTGQVVGRVERVLLDPVVGVLCCTDVGPAAIHDADTAQVLDSLCAADGEALTDAALEDWLDGAAVPAPRLKVAAIGVPGAPGATVPVQRCPVATWPALAGFVLVPAP
jgi:hypothetical protein